MHTLQVEGQSRELFHHLRHPPEDGWLFRHVKIRDPSSERNVTVEFHIAAREKELVLLEWVIRGTDHPASGASRIPLNTYARVAAYAVIDALEQGKRDMTYSVDQ